MSNNLPQVFTLEFMSLLILLYLWSSFWCWPSLWPLNTRPLQSSDCRVDRTVCWLIVLVSLFSWTCFLLNRDNCALHTHKIRSTQTMWTKWSNIPLKSNRRSGAKYAKMIRTGLVWWYRWLRCQLVSLILTFFIEERKINFCFRDGMLECILRQ